MWGFWHMIKKSKLSAEKCLCSPCISVLFHRETWKMATGWGAASIPLRIALVVLCLALVVFVIGFATKGWSHRKYASEISVPNLRIPVYVEYELGLWAYDVCYTDRTDYRFGSRAASLARQYYQCTDSDIGGFIGTLPCGGRINNKFCELSIPWESDKMHNTIINWLIDWLIG